MMPKISINPFKPQNISDAVLLENLCFSAPWSENAFKEAVSAGNSSFFAAKYGDEFAGFAGMYAAAEKEGYIYNIAVHNKFRNRGIGGALIKKLLDYSKEKNLEFLSLEVRKSNENAIKLYEKYGFRKVGIRKNFYDKPREDAIIMTFYTSVDF